MPLSVKASVMFKRITGSFAVRTVANFGLRNENEISTVNKNIQTAR